VAENSDGVGMVDGLFGPQPVERVRGRGRPAHAWERQNSLRICNLFACGHDVATVAEVIGLSQPTLRKVYFSEVAARKTMALRVKSQQLARLTESAIAGNVAAEKALAGMIAGEQAKVAGERIAHRGAAQTETKLGKKAEAKNAADALGGRFRTRAAPPGMMTH